MSAPLISIAERVEGTRRILGSDGWEWVVCPDEFSDAEPRIADEHLAPKLGMEVRRLRELSKRYEKDGHVTPVFCRTVRQTRGRPGVQRFYSEADALFLVTRSEREEAIGLTKGMILVVLAIRRHLAETVAVRAHERALPGTRTPPASSRAMELARWLATRTGTTPEAVLTAALDAWADASEGLPRADLYHSPRTPRALMVFVSEGTYEALAASLLADGLAPEPSHVSVIASDVLTGHAYMQRAFCGLGSRSRRGPNWLNPPRR